MILSSEPASYAKVLVLLSGRFLVQAVEPRMLMPRVCDTFEQVEERIRDKFALPCLLVVEETLAPDPVRHVLVDVLK